MRILLVEPYFGGSHRQWAWGFQKHSRHEVHILSLSAHHWKWRMRGAAITLARQFLALSFSPDLILVSDMLDLPTFLAFASRKCAGIRTAVYFHENQLTYPWSPDDADPALDWDFHYGYINFASALVADRVLFNSHYHKDSFLKALPAFLGRFPDHQEQDAVAIIEEKSCVMPLAMDLVQLSMMVESLPEKPHRAVILWNHRWEYDKNPDEFFKTLFSIKDAGWDFKLIVLGKKFKNAPPIFEEAKLRLADNILHWGYARTKAEYAQWLALSDILPVTSYQDYFGGSVVEAMYFNIKPLLPDRLAYPEHFPEHLRKTFFYDDGDLSKRLLRWIKDIDVIRKQQTRSFVEKYDWSNQISEMDETFSKLRSGQV